MMNRKGVHFYNWTLTIIGVLFLLLGMVVLWFGIESASSSNEEEVATLREVYLIMDALTAIASQPVEVNGETRLYGEWLDIYFATEIDGTIDAGDAKLREDIAGALKAHATKAKKPYDEIAKEAGNSEFKVLLAQVFYDDKPRRNRFNILGGNYYVDPSSDTSIVLPHRSGQEVILLWTGTPNTFNSVRGTQ